VIHFPVVVCTNSPSMITSLKRLVPTVGEAKIIARVKYALHGYLWIRSRLRPATKSPQRWGVARVPYWAASWRTAARPQS
jgi:hypothetical protein